MSKRQGFYVISSLIIFLLSGCFLDMATRFPPGYDENRDTDDLVGYGRFFDPQLDHHLTITMTESEWIGLSTDMEDLQIAYGTMKTGNLRRARVTYTGAAGSLDFKDVGIRTRGNTSREFPENTGRLNSGDKGIINQAHFQLKFDEAFDLPYGSIAYQNRMDRRFFALSTLALKSANGNGPNVWGKDQSLIREVYSYNFLNEIGVNTSKASVGTLKFVLTDNNGQVTRTLYFGPYSMIEPINKTFLSKRFGKDGNDGNLYKCLWQAGGPATLEEPVTYFPQGWGNPDVLGSENWRINYHPSYDLNTNMDKPDHSGLKSFVTNLNTLSGATLKAYLDQKFEVDRFLRWLAGNVILGMPDDYWAMGNNYYLYFNNKTGKAELLPYDYDHTLGGGWVPFDTANADVYQWKNTNQDLTGVAYAHPLVTKVLGIAEYKAQYDTYLKQFTGLVPSNNFLSAAQFQAIWEKVSMKLSMPKSSTPGDTWLTGIANFYNSTTKAISTYTITPAMNPYLAAFFSQKKASVQAQVMPTVNLSSAQWTSPAGLGAGWVNFAIPLAGGSFTAELTSTAIMNSVKWEISPAPESTLGGGPSPWTDLGTDTTPGKTFSKVVTFPVNHTEAGVYLRATAVMASGATQSTTQKITLCYQTPAGETVTRSGTDVTFRLKDTWPWQVALRSGRTYANLRVVGDFNAWGGGAPLTNGAVMTYNGGTGLYSATLTAAAGQTYKIWVQYSDGSTDWLSDMTNPLQIPNGYLVQGYNSLTP